MSVLEEILTDMWVEDFEALIDECRRHVSGHSLWTRIHGQLEFVPQPKLSVDEVLERVTERYYFNERELEYIKHRILS